jgi:hypothetical protein
MIIVQREFRQQVGHTLITFEAGRVIQDEVMEALLQRSNAPVEIISKTSDLIHCPHCRKTFTVRQAVRSEPKTETEKSSVLARI